MAQLDKEYACMRPNLKGGEPDRVDNYMNASANTLENAIKERDQWIALGEKAVVVSRQWEIDDAVKDL